MPSCAHMCLGTVRTRRDVFLRQAGTPWNSWGTDPTKTNIVCIDIASKKAANMLCFAGVTGWEREQEIRGMPKGRQK